MNKWHQLARDENHFPQLPPTPDHEKMDWIATKEASVLAEIQKQGLTVNGLSKATGMNPTAIRVALIGLLHRQEIVAISGNKLLLTYHMPNAVPTEAVVDRYPNTVITERRSSSEGNGINARPMIAVRLPAPPPSLRMDWFSQPVTAQTQEGRSTGRVGADT